MTDLIDRLNDPDLYVDAVDDAIHEIEDLRAEVEELQQVSRQAVELDAQRLETINALRARVAEAVRMIEGYKRAGWLTNPAAAEQAADFISRATSNKPASREDGNG